MKNWLLVIGVTVMLAGFSGPVFADDVSVDKKLNRILQNQDQIFTELASIRSELQVIKIRSSN